MPTTSKQGRCPNRQTSSTFVHLEPFRVTSILQLGVRLGDSTSFFFTQMGKPWYLINPNISCARTVSTVSTNGHFWKAMVQSIGVGQFRFVNIWLPPLLFASLTPLWVRDSSWKMSTVSLVCRASSTPTPQSWLLTAEVHQNRYFAKAELLLCQGQTLNAILQI